MENLDKILRALVLTGIFLLGFTSIAAFGQEVRFPEEGKRAAPGRIEPTTREDSLEDILRKRDDIVEDQEKLPYRAKSEDVLNEQEKLPDKATGDLERKLLKGDEDCGCA